MPHRTASLDACLRSRFRTSLWRTDPAHHPPNSRLSSEWAGAQSCRSFKTKTTRCADRASMNISWPTLQLRGDRASIKRVAAGIDAPKSTAQVRLAESGLGGGCCQGFRSPQRGKSPILAATEGERTHVAEPCIGNTQVSSVVAQSAQIDGREGLAT